MASDLLVSLRIRAYDSASSVVRKMRSEVRALGDESRKLKSSIDFASLKASGSGLASSYKTATSEITKTAKQLTVLGGVAAYGFKRLIIDPAAQMEKFRAVLTSVEGSSEQAEKSLTWVSEFARTTPFEIAGVTKAYQVMKNFGLDPMNGTMKAVADQASALGASQEDLEGISLALGQSWSATKLQGQDILQLINRGVPVWDLLAKATGRSIPQLKEMSSKGQLGRDAIKALIDEMGKQNFGASAEQMKTWNGVMSNLSDTWFRFRTAIAGAGIFDYLKEELSGMLKSVDELSASGELQGWAKQIGEGMTSAAKSLKSFLQDSWPGIKKVFTVDIPRFVDMVGGWKNALIIVAVAMKAQLIVAVGQMVSSLFTLSKTIITNVIPAVARFSWSIISRAVPAIWGFVSTAVPAAIAGIKSIAASFIASAPAIFTVAAPFLAVGAAIASVTLAVRQLIKIWDDLNITEVFDGIKETFSGEGILGTLGQLFDPSALFSSIGDDLGLGSGRSDVQRVGTLPAATARASANVQGNIGVSVSGPGQVTSVQSSGPVGLSVDSGLAGAGI